MTGNEQGNLDDDAWSYCQSRVKRDALEAISWILSGWSIRYHKTDTPVAEMVAHFIRSNGPDMTDKYPQSS